MSKDADLGAPEVKTHWDTRPISSMDLLVMFGTALAAMKYNGSDAKVEISASVLARLIEMATKK